MQIAFWSNMHGQTGNTSNMIAIACSIALNYQIKTLITQIQFDKSGLETALLDQDYLKPNHGRYEDIGMDALYRLIGLNSTEEELISGYTTSLLKGKLDLLIGTQNINESLYLKEFGHTMDMVLPKLKTCYDLVLIDVMAGNHQFAKKILQNSDLIIVSLNQNRLLLDDFFNKNYEDLKDKCFLILGMYNDRSKFCLKNIKRRYKFNRPIGTIPYCRGYADAFNEGRTIDFFLRNRQVKKHDTYGYFIHEVNKSTSRLMASLGMDIKRLKEGD